MAKDVRIMTPFDTSKISVSQNPRFPEAYIVDLPLDSVPDREWREAFDLKWKSSRDLWDRKLLLIQDKVRLITTADEFMEKLDWVERTIRDTNIAIKDQYRIIDKEKEMIQEATTKQVLQTDMHGSEAILDTLRKRFSM
ncbi:MAG: hypothetical protein ABSB89_09830 [Candidatus Bathyarchaeia archaeon]|jgi:hypothetical protein